MNCIFGVHIDLEDIARTFHDSERRNHYTTAARRFKQYSKRFIASHMTYADSIQAHYHIVGNDEYNEMCEEYDLDFIDNLYFKLNLTKFYVIEKLVKQWDNVLYLDLDVVPQTTEDFFVDNNTQVGNCMWNFPVPYITPELFDIHFWLGRGPMSNRHHIKKRFTKQLYLQQIQTNFEGDSLLINTGVIGTSLNPWNALHFFQDFEHMLRTSLDAAQQLGEEYVDWAFEGDTLIGIQHQKHCDSVITTIDDEWNYAYKTDKDISSAKFVHLISKSSVDNFFSKG